MVCNCSRGYWWRENGWRIGLEIQKLWCPFLTDLSSSLKSSFLMTEKTSNLRAKVSSIQNSSKKSSKYLVSNKVLTSFFLLICTVELKVWQPIIYQLIELGKSWMPLLKALNSIVIESFDENWKSLALEELWLHVTESVAFSVEWGWKSAW